METTLNIPRLTELRTFLAEHPEQHNQGIWGEKDAECGTVACAAGWTVLLFDPSVRAEFDRKKNWWSLTSVVREVRGEEWPGVPYVARELLGLPWSASNALFYEADTRECALEILDALIASGGNVDESAIWRIAMRHDDEAAEN